MRRLLFVFVWAISLATISSCSQKTGVEISFEVKDIENSASLPNATIELYRFYEGGQPVFVDSFQTNEAGIYPAFKTSVEKGYKFKVVASKPYYEPVLSGNGAYLKNEKIIDPANIPRDTLTLFLKSAVSPNSGSQRKKMAKSNVNELIGSLKAGNWEGNFIPRLTWGDIPGLLEHGEDSAIIKHFPIKTGSKLQPDSARVGQVALWMIEAIRRDVSRKVGDKPIFLMPPSNVPVLGTRRGNPRLFNSKGALKKAHEAYIKWWENGPISDTLKKAKRNPLRGTGLGWM
ncbi:MAG: DUF4943 domain-containing protein [Bacteroidia bacterium]|nr:DUF4943 domain-containing protein [Bacteroidia bacterium]